MTLSKKIFFISLSFFCVTLLFFGIYYLVFRKEADTTPVAEKKASETPTQSILPTVSNEPIMAISQEAVLAPTIPLNTKAIKYYAKNSGRVYQVDFNGMNKRTFSEQELIGLNSALWSPDKNKAITKFINAGKIKFYHYDHLELKGEQLKENIDEIAWQSSSNRIFFKHYDEATKKRTLNISDPDGSNWKNLAEIPFRDISIAQVPQSSLVSFWNKPDAFFETNFKSIPLTGGEEKTILQGVFGADYLWNNDGTAALVSHSDTKGGTKIQLSSINSNGGEFRNLNFPTLVSKCVWLKNNKAAYCALPGKIPASAIMPNEYDQEKFHTADTFWKIKPSSGEKSRIIELEKINGEYDATNLFLSDDEGILFFINRTDGKLYRLTL